MRRGGMGPVGRTAYAVTSFAPGGQWTESRGQVQSHRCLRRLHHWCSLGAARNTIGAA